VDRFLENRVAIVVGGSGGIGRAVAAALMEHGARVMICARRKEGLEEALAGLQRIHGEVGTLSCDVSKSQEVRGMVEATVNRFSGVDILVNAAGIVQKKSLHRISEEDWDQTIDVNLKGAFLCAQAVFPHMKRQRNGWIINVASYVGKVGLRGFGHYSSSKFGMVGLTQALSDEGEPFNIRATSICPSYVNTPLMSGSPFAPDDILQPSDICHAILFLLRLTPCAVVKEIVLERKGGLVPSSAAGNPIRERTGKPVDRIGSPVDE